MADAEQLTRVAQFLCSRLGHECLGKVGEGAFKETYRVARDGTTSALKVFKPAGVSDRVKREVSALLRCDHPNVAKLKLLDVCEFEGIKYVYSLEEYLDGGSLDERISQAPLSQAELRSMATTLIDAVGHVASKGLVHRDLKPANIMLRKASNEPVLVDFGLVRDLDASSLTKTFLPQGPGTPLFAPPEQLNNEKALIDWRADQFSLGVLLSISGGGGHPYEDMGDAPLQIVEKVAGRKGPSARFAAWAADQGLSQLVQMVAAWPVRRYRTPRALADAWSTQGGSQ